MVDKKTEKGVMTGYHAEQFLKKYLPVSQSQLVKKFSKITITTPLVLKIMSPDALHKTDIGGVRIIKSQAEVESQFNDLMAIVKEKKMRLEGIMVQKFVEGVKNNVFVVNQKWSLDLLFVYVSFL